MDGKWIIKMAQTWHKNTPAPQKFAAGLFNPKGNLRSRGVTKNLLCGLLQIRLLERYLSSLDSLIGMENELQPLLKN